MSEGNCFQVATGFLRSGMIELVAQHERRPVMYGDKSQWRIVHGLPVGDGGVVEGQRHWHAWVELTLDSGVVLALDLSNNKDLRMLRDVYYQAGQLDEEHVWRFTPAEAKKLFRKTGHCGPWVDGWETMGVINMVQDDGDR